MFSFKKKKQEKSLGEGLSQVAAAMSTLCATAGIMLDRPSVINGANNIKREAAIVELKRLKQDHWDKDAFDRVIKFICEI